VCFDLLQRFALVSDGRRDQGRVHPPRRTIRIPDDLWDAATARAEKRGESVSDVIRHALERYLGGK